MTSPFGIALLEEAAQWSRGNFRVFIEKSPVPHVCMTLDYGNHARRRVEYCKTKGCTQETCEECGHYLSTKQHDPDCSIGGHIPIIWAKKPRIRPHDEQ